MRNKIVMVGAIFLLAGVVLAGCQRQQENSATQQVKIPEAVKQVVVEKTTTAVEAIKQSEAILSIQDKVRYLIGEANNFYDAKQFQPVIDIAQYILGNLDANSSPAQSLLEKAKQGLQAAAQSTVSDVTQKLNAVGD
jgi:hypothetical protein